jgi:hypothetical protein
LAGRAEPSGLDLSVALTELGASVEDVVRWAETSDLVPFAKGIQLFMTFFWVFDSV